jgi:hypothetical protein
MFDGPRPESVALCHSVAFEGLDARRVEVQCAVTPGLPGFSIVGLPDKAVSEARERVRTALQAMAIALPSKRVTINLSPADLPKEGSHFDLPITLALLAAIGIVPADKVSSSMALGELSLDGRLVAVHGALPTALAAGEDDLVLLCPAGLRRGGGMGRRDTSLRRRLAGGACGPPDRSRAAGTRPPRRGDRHARPAASPRCADRNAPSARWRSPRRAATTPDDRRAGIGKIHARRAPAGHHAAADGARSAGNLDDPLARGAAGRRRHLPHAPLPRAAPHRLHGRHRGRRARRETGGGVAGP